MSLNDYNWGTPGNPPEYKDEIESCEGCGKEMTGDDFNYEYGEPLCNGCIEKRENENQK